jgi:hypothetical protein
VAARNRQSGKELLIAPHIIANAPMNRKRKGEYPPSRRRAA